MKGSSPHCSRQRRAGSGRAIVRTRAVRENPRSRDHRLLAAEIGVNNDSQAFVRTLARNDRLINLSQHFGASRYLSGNAARDYIGLGLFTAVGIKVIWHNYVLPTYSQEHFCYTYRCSILR
jgi:hypothetical protein